MRSENDILFLKIESSWMERIIEGVWNHFNFEKRSYYIGNDQYLRNQSVQFHLQQIATNCKIQNRTRIFQLNRFLLQL